MPEALMAAGSLLHLLRHPDLMIGISIDLQSSVADSAALRNDYSTLHCE